MHQIKWKIHTTFRMLTLWIMRPFSHYSDNEIGEKWCTTSVKPQQHCDCENWPLCHTLMNFSFTAAAEEHCFLKRIFYSLILHRYSDARRLKKSAMPHAAGFHPKELQFPIWNFSILKPNFAAVVVKSRLKSIRNCNSRPELLPQLASVIKIQFNSKDNEIVVGFFREEKSPKKSPSISVLH